MFRFIRESVKEFDHVVFPTRQETKTYFIMVVGVIIVMMIYVFIVSSAIGEGFGFIRSKTSSDQAFDPSSLLQSSGSEASMSGVTVSGSGLSGATVTPSLGTGAAVEGINSTNEVPPAETPTAPANN